MDNNVALAIAQRKSVGVAVLLTVVFGGLGLFYSSILGGLLMSALWGLGLILTFLTLGVGGVLLFPVWVVSIFWAVLATQHHNNKLMRAATRQSAPAGER